MEGNVFSGKTMLLDDLKCLAHGGKYRFNGFWHTTGNSQQPGQVTQADAVGTDEKDAVVGTGFSPCHYGALGLADEMAQACLMDVGAKALAGLAGGSASKPMAKNSARLALMKIIILYLSL